MKIEVKKLTNEDLLPEIAIYAKKFLKGYFKIDLTICVRIYPN